MSIGLWVVLLTLVLSPSLWAQERIVGEGDHGGFIVNEGKQVLKVSPIKPGQTLQLSLLPQWGEQLYGTMTWRLEDSEGNTLGTGLQTNPGAELISVEWTSNSQPKPSAYFLQVQGTGGTSPGEILGQYTLYIFLVDQNDGNSGTDAPESYDKALLLPVSEAGTYLFDECFISPTADTYDVYKIQLPPNRSLTLRAKPVHWKGAGTSGKVHFEFLNKSLKRLKGGDCFFGQSTPFTVRVFQPRLKGDPKPALFYLLVKVEGEMSALYSIEAEMKEGP